MGGLHLLLIIFCQTSWLSVLRIFECTYVLRTYPLKRKKILEKTAFLVFSYVVQVCLN